MQETEEITSLLKDPLTRRECFSNLVRQYQKPVYGIIRKMIIDHDDTDDLVQEVFVKVWNNLDRFQGTSSIFTWIYRIATNEALQYLRKKKSRNWFNAAPDQSLIDALESEEHIDADEVQRKLQKAILRLPDKQRLVFNLRYFEELSYEDIAAITDTSVGALKANFHHAVKKIEDFLKD